EVVFESPAAHEQFAPIALSLPPDLPTSQDLELGTPLPVAQTLPAAAPAHELSFELDLSKFDASIEPVAPPTADALGVDTGAPSLFDPFEVAETGPLPLPVDSDRIEAVEPAAMDLIDIDLGGDL